jgi:hypothetical protein
MKKGRPPCGERPLISPFELVSALAQRVDRFILAGFIWANVSRREGAAFPRGGLLTEKTK